MAGRPSPLARLGRAFWVELPVWLARFAPQTANSFTDGQHLLRWPATAALLPVIAFVAGIGLEVSLDGAAFTTSIVVLGAMAVIGASSVQLGWWAFLGFVVARVPDPPRAAPFFPGPEAIPDVLEGPLALTVELALLFTLAVLTPSMILGVRMMMRLSGFSAVVGPVGERMGHVAATIVGYALWTRAAVLPVRSIHLVVGRRLEADPFRWLQDDWRIIVALAVAAVVLRWVVEAVALRPESVAWIQQMTHRMQPRVTAAPTSLVWPWLGRVAFGMVYLSGLIATWWQFGVSVAVLVLAAIARELLGVTAPGRVLTRSPLLARLGVAAFLGYLLVGEILAIATDRLGDNESFFPSLVAMWLLVPLIAVLTARRRADGDGGRDDDDAGGDGGQPVDGRSGHWRGSTGGSARRSTLRRGGALFLVCLAGAAILLAWWAEPAAADNCTTPSDCGDVVGVSLMLFGVLLIASATFVVFTGGAGGVVLLGLTATELQFLGAAVTIGGAASLAATDVAGAGGAGLGWPSPPSGPTPPPNWRTAVLAAGLGTLGMATGGGAAIGTALFWPERADPGLGGGAGTVSGVDAAGRPLEPLPGPFTYRDGDGVVRWADTHEPVSQRPNRDQIRGGDGIWRWADTLRPVFQADPGLDMAGERSGGGPATTAPASQRQATPMTTPQNAGGAASTTSTTVGEPPGPDGTYVDQNGDVRHIADNRIHDPFGITAEARVEMVSTQEIQAAIADPASTVTVQGTAYPTHQVSFHPVTVDGEHARYYPSDWAPGEPVYEVRVIGDGAPLPPGMSDTLIDASDVRDWHLDIENAPNRPGQLHLQYRIGGVQNRHIYDFHRGVFLPSAGGSGDPVPPWLLRRVASDPEWLNALDAARHRLDVPWIGDQP